MKLILVRGLPGSGKSTLAKSLINENTVHLETDMFWGIDYNFNFSRLNEAHAWCREETECQLALGMNVVVSNTFTTKKELKPYFDIAKNFDIIPTVIVCQNSFGNIHNVPEEVMQRMHDRFDYDISRLFAKEN